MGESGVCKSVILCILEVRRLPCVENSDRPPSPGLATPGREALSPSCIYTMVSCFAVLAFSCHSSQFTSGSFDHANLPVNTVINAERGDHRVIKLDGRDLGSDQEQGVSDPSFWGRTTRNMIGTLINRKY